MVDPLTDISVISNKELLEEFKSPKKYKRMNLYAVMSQRANFNTEIKQCLFDQILDEDIRKEVVLGTIMHSWFPAIYILKQGNDMLKKELREVLRQWTNREKKLFLDYIKSDQEYYCLLYDIVDHDDNDNKSEEE